MKKQSFLIPSLLLALIWIIFFSQVLFNIDLSFLTLAPGDKTSPYSIITSVFLHGGLQHIVGNSIPLLIYSTCVFYFYKHVSYIVTVSLILIPSLFTWFVGIPGSHHLGISGVVFGLASFLIVAGLKSKEFTKFALAIFVLYSFKESFIYIFPVTFYMSWESHLGGFLTGIALGFILPSKYEQNCNH